MTARLKAALREVEDTDCVSVGEGVIESTGAILRDLWPNDQFVVVADLNTWNVAGEALVSSLKKSGVACKRLILESQNLSANYDQVCFLRHYFHQVGGIPIALGSGTINDLVKLAADESQRRYGVVATAASMDGYASYGSSIMRDGVKQTIYCCAPRLVLADTKILETAPQLMNAAGYADLLAKQTAGADWLVAEALGIEAIHKRAWAFTQDALSEWTEFPEAIHAGEPAALGRLFEGLIFAGLGMQVARSSRPASGAEHLLSHLWDMQDINYQGERPSHGLKVGIGTLLTAGIYDFFQKWPLPENIESRLHNWPNLQAVLDAAINLHGEPKLACSAAKAVKAKYLNQEQMRQRYARLRSVWPELSRRLAKQVAPPGSVRVQLSTAGALIDPRLLGLDRKSLYESFFQAATIRDRYTILDLAFELGILEDAATHSIAFSK
jgi:glycerol-1-phosphate dehydrogenase [NAD(P)+]